MAQVLSPEEYESITGEFQAPKAQVLTPEEYESILTGAMQYDGVTFGDYLRAVPATGADIAIGSVEGLASAIGAVTGDYDFARSISEIRTDVNDAIMGDAPDELKSDFAYKLASGLGSTLPYLGAALVARRPEMIARIGANGFFLASAGQQVRDDYLANQGVTSETATDEQMAESNKVGAIGAIPIALAEKLGAGLILKPFAKGAIPAGQVMERIGQYVGAGIGEAATEVMQSGIINSIASYVGRYDPDRPITQGMVESAMIGFLVGGGVNATIDTVNRAVTQSDRLKAGVADGSLNAKDVLDPDVGGPMAAIAMENGSIPEVDTRQQSAVTDPQGISNFISKTLTPLSRRLGRAGKEVVREFRKFELETGVKVTEFRKAVNPFSKQMLELKKKSPEDYRILSLALANANELATSLPDSVQQDLGKKSQIQPEIQRSASEQLLDTTNADAAIINQQIDQARQSIANLGLGTQIQVIESGSSYYDPQSNTIAISATEADGTTVAHEYFHAVLGQAVKTDLELQSMTRNMFDSVIRASVDGSSLNTQLKDFVAQYDQNVQNEEFLAQTVGELARQYQTLDINTRTRVKLWLNQAMRLIGLDGIFKQAETDSEVIEQLNAFARFAGQPEALTENTVSRDVKTGTGGPISAPIRGSKLQIKDLSLAPRVSFTKTPRKNSNITSSDSFDMLALLDEIVRDNLKVTFWSADQMGIGNYTSPISKNNYFLDAGLGFAKNKKGKAKDYVWASTQMGAVQQAAESDIVMIISGDPDTMHYFNKIPATILYDNIESKYGSLEKFADAIIKAPNAKGLDISFANKFLNEYADRNSIINNKDGNVKRKFMENVRARQIATTSDSVKSIINEVMPSNAELVDAHLTKNNFGIRDIYAAFRPNGKYTTEKTKGIHKTYEYGISGDFLGTPDIRVNIEDIINPQFLEKLKKDSYEEYLQKFIETEKIGKPKKDGTIPIPDLETAKVVAKRYGLNIAKLTGGATGAKTFIGKDFRVKEQVLEMKGLQNTTPEDLIGSLNRASERISKKQLRARKIGEGELMDRLDSITKPRVKGSDRFRKWFGKGELVHPDGTPMVFFHGTKTEDIKAFDPKFTQGLVGEHGWLFFSSDPDLSLKMATMQDKSRTKRKSLSKTEEKEFFKNKSLQDEYLIKVAENKLNRLKKESQNIEGRLSKKSIDRILIRADVLEQAILSKDIETLVEEFVNSYQALDLYFNEKFGFSQTRLRLYEDINLIPVYLNAENIFNPTNGLMVDELIAHMREKYSSEIAKSKEEGYDIDDKRGLMTGVWRAYENSTAAKSLRELGYDGIALKEADEFSTIAVWNPTLDKSKYRTTPYVKSVFNKGTWQLTSSQIKEQRKRTATASEEEIIRGLSDDGMAILQKYGMVDNYREVRSVLDAIKNEYIAQGLDANFIDNYFPRLVKDIEGLKTSFGMPTGIVDQEIRRYEQMTGQTLSDTERQMMYEKLARSKLYRGGLNTPSNLKERKISLLEEPQLKYYADPEQALDSYIEKMVNAIETKKLIGDAASGKSAGAEPVAGRLGEVMDNLAKQGRLRQDQIDVIQGAVQARFGQHGRQYGFVKGVKNMGYLATMGNVGSTLTQLGDFYFTMVQNGLIPTVEAALGRKRFTIEDLGLAKDQVSTEHDKGADFFASSVRTVFKLTGITSIDRLAKNTNINAAFKTLTKGAKAGQNTNRYKKTLARLKRTQGNDAYKTIADLQNGVKSDLVIEALYNELADVAPISLTEMPEAYASNPNTRILYSLKSYTIKQFNFLRERVFVKLMDGIVEKNPKKVSEASVDMARILAFTTLANGSADVLKAIIFNREIDDEEFWWNTFLRMFGITKYTTVKVRKEGLGQAMLMTIAPPQVGILNDIGKDIINAEKIADSRSMKYMPLVGKLYYWRDGRGVEVEEKLSRLRENN